jgi:hypothetical protein
MPAMTCRTNLARLAAACLIAACCAITPQTAQAQGVKETVEVFKSRAEVVNAEALNKQANAAIINADANHMKAAAESRKMGQETRKLSAENDLLEAKVFYDKKALYHAHRQAHQPPKSTPEQHAQRARQAAPTRLASYQLWARPGYVRWPSLLLHAEYADVRTLLDHLVAQRSPADSGAGSQNCVDIQQGVDRFKTALNSQIKQYKPADYIAAKKFLDSLAYEVQFPVDHAAGQVAQR